MIILAVSKARSKKREHCGFKIFNRWKNKLKRNFIRIYRVC